MTSITVQKLINILSKLDPDLEVWILDSEGGEYPIEGCKYQAYDDETKIIEIY